MSRKLGLGLGLMACLALVLGSLTTGERPTSPTLAILALVSSLLLELRATPLALGYFSPSCCWAVALTGLGVLGLPWVMACLACALTLRSLFLPASPNGALADLLVDFLPAALAAWAAKTLGLLPALPVYWLVAVPLPLWLSRWLAPRSRAGRDRATLTLEQLALVTLGPAASLLGRVHPALMLGVWPSILALLKAAFAGVELQERRAQHRSLRAARNELNFQEKLLNETEERQLKVQRLLDARAETFELLESLSARGLSEKQALDLAVRALREKLPGAQCDFVTVGQSGPEFPASVPPEIRTGVQTAWLQQEPWLRDLKDSAQAAWPLPQRGLVVILAPVPLTPELQHTLRVFFYYLNVMLERVRFQENLVQALNVEAGLRKELSLAVTRLQALLSGASELASLVQPRDILQLTVERVRQWTGRDCAAIYAGISVATPPPGSLSLPLSGGEFRLAAEGLEDSELEAVRLWLVLAGGALDRCQAQATLVQSSKLAAIGQLAAGVAHELNTPLGSISLALGMAERNLEKNPAKALSRLEIARKSTDQMRVIVAKLLNYSRESGEGRKTVSLAEIVQDSVQMVDQSFQMENVELLTQVEEGLVEVNAGEIQQVLINLLVNARLAVAGRPSPQVHIKVARSLRQGRPWMEVQVIDNGPGVPNDLAERIFEPFFTTRDVGTGVGLGLSISREILTAHGGELSYRAAPAGGACFHFDLPVCEE